MWPETTTPCACSEPGWCERHRCVKTAQWHLLCRLDQFAFQLWEAGDGPCLDRPPKEFAELPRCRHRSLEPVDQVECELCGGRTSMLPVYDCDLFGRCTPRRYGSRTHAARTMPACIACEEYSAVDQVDASLAPQ